jgi:hypothetical protein
MLGDGSPLRENCAATGAAFTVSGDAYRASLSEHIAPVKQLIKFSFVITLIQIIGSKQNGFRQSQQ